MSSHRKRPHYANRINTRLPLFIVPRCLTSVKAPPIPPLRCPASEPLGSKWLKSCCLMMHLFFVRYRNFLRAAIHNLNKEIKTDIRRFDIARQTRGTIMEGSPRQFFLFLAAMIPDQQEREWHPIRLFRGWRAEILCCATRAPCLRSLWLLP